MTIITTLTVESDEFIKEAKDALEAWLLQCYHDSSDEE